MTLDDRMYWTFIGNVALLEVNMQEMTEEQTLEGLYRLRGYYNDLKDESIHHKILLLDVNNLSLNISFAKAMQSHLKTGAVMDEQLAYGKIKPMILVIINIAAKILGKRPKLFRNRYEALEYVKVKYKV